MTEIKQNVNYSWDPESKIEITGAEYATIRHTVMLFEAAIGVCHGVFQRMLNENIAKESSIDPTDKESYIPQSEVIDEHVPHVD